MLLPEKISSLFGDTFCPLLGQVVLVIVDEVVGVFHPMIERRHRAARNNPRT
jgi:hypothetical protein